MYNYTDTLNYQMVDTLLFVAHYVAYYALWNVAVLYIHMLTHSFKVLLKSPFNVHLESKH